MREGPGVELTVEGHDEKYSYISLSLFFFFCIVIFLWQTKAFSVSYYMGQPCVSCALESPVWGGTHRVAAAWNSVEMAVGWEAQDRSLESGRKQPSGHRSSF